MIHLIIPAIPPSNNQFMGKGMLGKRYEYQKLKKSWHDLISLFFNQAKRELPEKILSRMPFEKSLLHITYYFPDRRRRDPDNYSGKFIADSLVKNGILKDDSFANVTLKLEGVDRISEEMADIIISWASMAGRLQAEFDMDMEYEVMRKMTLDEGRPYRNGKLF